MAGCSLVDRAPVIVDPEITVIGRTDTSITIRWTPAENEPFFGAFEYQVFAAGSDISSPSDLDGLTPKVEGTAKTLGEAPLSVTLTNLSVGTGYFVNVAVSDPRSGDIDVYDGVVAFTVGSSSFTSVYSGDPYFIYNPDTQGIGVEVDLAVDLGGSVRDVYLVLANEAETLSGFAPSIEGGAGTTGAGASASQAPPARSLSAEPAGPVVLRDRPDILGWEPPPLTSGSRGGGTTGLASMSPALDAPGLSGVFYDNSIYATIDATCRAVVPNGAGMTLSVWVEDSEWDDVLPTDDMKINQDMVDFLAATFLKTGDNNDIYDWLTAIYGDEWGLHGYDNLIPDQNNITILLYNIGSDGAGGVVGYFWAKDNFTAESIPYSNERVMFYLDSQSLGKREGITWEESDEWPLEIVSTLAHEFQHMIHFYQRDILQGTTTQVWLNELMSMVSEDLVAKKLYDEFKAVLEYEVDIAGPRGVPPSTNAESGDAGGPGNSDGRLPYFNATPTTGLSYWPLGSTNPQVVLPHYAVSYAFGAYISRVYGGADLLAAMMNSGSSDEVALMESATGEQFATLLAEWGVSVLLSEDTAAPSAVRLNTGAWVDSASVLAGYDLGSIDHYNYLREGSLVDAGPLIYTPATYPGTRMEGTSLLFYELALGASGVVEASLLLPAGVSVTVVVK